MRTLFIPKGNDLRQNAPNYNKEYKYVTDARWLKIYFQSENHCFLKLGLKLTLTWDVDCICDTAGLELIGISHVEKLNVTIGQHGLQLRVGHH